MRINDKRFISHPWLKPFEKFQGVKVRISESPE